MLEVRLQRLHPEATLPRAVAGSRGLKITAHLLTEKGMATRTMIPPKSAAAIPTGWQFVGSQELYGVRLTTPPRLLIAQTMFVVDCLVEWDMEMRVPIYNGGYETQWVSHDEAVAILVSDPLTQVYPGVVG